MLLEVLRLLFTVLVYCLLAAFDLTIDIKHHVDSLLGFEVSGYIAVVLFRNSYVDWSQQMAVRCQTNEWITFN